MMWAITKLEDFKKGWEFSYFHSQTANVNVSSKIKDNHGMTHFRNIVITGKGFLFREPENVLSPPHKNESCETGRWRPHKILNA